MLFAVRKEVSIVPLFSHDRGEKDRLVNKLVDEAE